MSAAVTRRGSRVSTVPPASSTPPWSNRWARLIGPAARPYVLATERMPEFTSTSALNTAFCKDTEPGA